MKTDVRISLPFIPGMELLAANAVQQYCEINGFSHTAANELAMATLEATINAIKHSQSKDQRVFLAIQQEQNKVKVLVHDHGEGFDVSKANTEFDSENILDLENKGLGLYIMKQLVDNVNIMINEHGTQILLTKNI
ncbi:MAG: hypothetical protein Kow00108_10190 [Calditrichia bacterium]